MRWSPAIPMGTVLEEGEGGELRARGWVRWRKTPRRGGGVRAVNIQPAICNGHPPS